MKLVTVAKVVVVEGGGNQYELAVTKIGSLTMGPFMFNNLRRSMESCVNEGGGGKAAST